MPKAKRWVLLTRQGSVFDDKVTVHTSASGTQYVVGSSLIPAEDEFKRVAAKRFMQIKKRRAADSAAEH